MTNSARRRRNQEHDQPPPKDVIVRGVNLTCDFECLGSGNCCRGSGYVQLERRDEARISEYLGLTLSEFHERFCEEEWDGSFVLVDHPESDACIFLDENNLCKIHEVKPQQCVDFPLKWRSSDFTRTCEGFKAAKKRAEEALNRVNPPE